MHSLVRAVFISCNCALFLASGATVAATVTVDVSANRRAIDPRVYGVAYASAAQLADLNAPLNRAGGNNSSRYNWLQNADNKDFDYFFQSIGDVSAIAGERGDTIFSDSKGAGAQAMLTIPMVGWVAKLGPGRSKLASFSIAKYGPQCSNDFMYFPDSGDGKQPDCVSLITGNDPNDANVVADANFQKAWVQHLVGKWGTAASGGVRYYILDNEHSIWFSTHRDVHPIGPHMTEIRDKMIQYATMIKSADAGAAVIGPEEYGWTGYIFSGFDQQWTAINGYSNIPDRTAMGGMDYMPWLLGQLKQSAISTGVRPIDVFSLHYYPQQNEFSNDIDNATQLLRNRSTRSLWDPAYVDTSYIQDVVQLIPRMRTWVDANYYPDTPIAITEYNWGAESHINGATTQADIYGIFGREGLNIGARWTTPDASTPTYNAMKMYRNYDGNKSTFGDTSVAAAVANPDNLSAFAAQRSTDGALTIIVVNKVLSGTTPLTLSISNFTGGCTATAYQISGASAGTIARLPDANVVANSITATLPAQSITLFVMSPPAGALALQCVQSRKVHGATGPHDLRLTTGVPITGDVVVEPRTIGSGHKIVFQFNSTVTSIGAVTATNAAAQTLSATPSFSANEVIVTLPNVPDNTRATINVPVVNNIFVDAKVSLGFLVGDINRSHAVNASDISAVKAHLNQPADINTFRFNVNVSGTTSTADVSAVKARTGLALP